MNKIELIFSPYVLKMSKPFITSKGSLKERKGFILKLTGSSGKTGIGDAAPFPEFGSESFKEAEKALNNFNLKFKLDLDNLFDSLDYTLSPLNIYPSLRHGFEQALLNLICNEKNISLNDLLGRSSLKIINVNAVVGLMTPKKSAQAALNFLEEGYSVLKVKIGRDTFRNDYDSIEAIKEAVGNKLKIRLDVNGKWNLEQAEKHLRKLENFDIEYVEQPVNSIDDFVKLSKLTNMPIAADESIRSLDDANNFINSNAAGVLILKPMMLGGIIPTLKIIDQASDKDIKTVITSSFESSVGRALAIFAASLVHENIAHGLATSSYFENDLTEDPYPVKHGKIFL